LFNFVFDLHDAKIYTMDDITKELIYSVGEQMANSPSKSN
jgi:hypothetical protein